MRSGLGAACPAVTICPQHATTRLVSFGANRPTALARHPSTKAGPKQGVCVDWSRWASHGRPNKSYCRIGRRQSDETAVPSRGGSRDFDNNTDIYCHPIVLTSPVPPPPTSRRHLSCQSRSPHHASWAACSTTTSLITPPSSACCHSPPSRTPIGINMASETTTPPRPSPAPFLAAAPTCPKNTPTACTPST